MTQAPNDLLDKLEATLTRFAELSFQSYRHHDETLSRLEANLTRLEANSVRHDEAIARMEEGLFRMEGAIIDLTSQQQRTDRALEALSPNSSRVFTVDSN